MPEDKKAERLLSWSDLRLRVPLCRATVLRDGTFPKPIQLSARRVAWRESDIDRWIADRATQHPR